MNECVGWLGLVPVSTIHRLPAAGRKPHGCEDLGAAMRWRQERQSSNIEDRRRSRPSGRTATAGAGLGGCGLVLVILIALVMGVDPSQLLQDPALSGGETLDSTVQYEESVAPDEMGEFVSAVLADTEDTWHVILDTPTQSYQEPKLVLFSGSVRSACGHAQAAMGPFYCPADRKVYLDTSFFNDLERRFGAPGDFAQAYVIAHEIGHHVQTLMGITPQVENLRRRSNRAQSNELSVRLELQADCLAGVWANQAQRRNLVLDMEDLEEGLNAASAIGDDRLQMQAQGYVVPDAFTHGSSGQRVEWFKRGLASGDIGGCDTFGAQQ